MRLDDGITNVDDSTSCWNAGNGTIDLDAGVITVIASSTDCTRHATGTITHTTQSRLVDKDYLYLSHSYSINWKTIEKYHWPVWHFDGGLTLDTLAPVDDSSEVHLV